MHGCKPRGNRDVCMCLHLHTAQCLSLECDFHDSDSVQSAVEQVHMHQGLIMLADSLDTVVITPAVQRLRYQDSHAPKPHAMM